MLHRCHPSLPDGARFPIPVGGFVHDETCPPLGLTPSPEPSDGIPNDEALPSPEFEAGFQLTTSQLLNCAAPPGGHGTDGNDPTS